MLIASENSNNIHNSRFLILPTTCISTVNVLLRAGTIFIEIYSPNDILHLLGSSEFSILVQFVHYNEVLIPLFTDTSV